MCFVIDTYMYVAYLMEKAETDNYLRDSWWSKELIRNVILISNLFWSSMPEQKLNWIQFVEKFLGYHNSK